MQCLEAIPFRIERKRKLAERYHLRRTTTQMLSRLAPSSIRRQRNTELLEMLFVPGVIVALVIYLSLTSQVFFTSENVRNIFLQATILGIVSFGMTFVILGGELDLSVGAGVALVSVIAAKGILITDSIVLGLLAGLCAGALIGAINGFLVTVVEVPSFMATLGTLIIAQGTALAITQGGVVAGLPASVGDLANTQILGFQVILWLLAAVFVVLYALQRQTAFGVRVLAVGGNSEAARLSGISVGRTKFLCFLIVGITVGIGGLVLMARVESGQPNAESLLGLEAIAAVVVGGNNLLGGRGSVAKTLWGVVLIAVLQNGLDVNGVSFEVEQIVIGCVFIAAASVDFVRRQLERRALRADLDTLGGNTRSG